jgi:hypothetical protein
MKLAPGGKAENGEALPALDNGDDVGGERDEMAGDDDDVTTET